MTTQFIELSENDFEDSFPLRQNHLNPHAGWAYGDGPGCLFETYGEELEFVRSNHDRFIWTLVDGDDGDMYIQSGYHFVNRVGYFISTHPLQDDLSIQVHIPFEDGDNA